MNTSKREDELKKRVEKTLKRKISDTVWQVLKDKEYIEEALEPAYEDGFNGLVKMAEIYMDAELGKTKRQGMKRYRDAAPEFLPPHDDPVMMRALYFSKYLGRVASRDNIVLLMRERLLSGQKISRQEASRLLKSEAPRFLRHSFFVSHGIPLIGHRSYYYNRKSKKQLSEYSESNSVLRIEWADKIHDIVDVAELQQELKVRGQEFYALGEGKTVIPGSVFDEIREASNELAARYLWEEAGATALLLTDNPPLVSQLLYRFVGNENEEYLNLRIELVIQPWISADTVRDAYRDIQKQLFGNRRKQVNMTTLQLFDFVQKKRHENPKLTWYQLQLDWNKIAEPRGLHCFDDYRHLRQAYERSRQAIMYPDVARRLNKSKQKQSTLL